MNDSSTEGMMSDKNDHLILSYNPVYLFIYYVIWHYEIIESSPPSLSFFLTLPCTPLSLSNSWLFFIYCCYTHAQIHTYIHTHIYVFIHIFLNKSCSMCSMILLYMFSWLTIWYWINSCCACLVACSCMIETFYAPPIHLNTSIVVFVQLIFS